MNIHLINALERHLQHAESKLASMQRTDKTTCWVEYYSDLVVRLRTKIAKAKYLGD